MAASNPNRRVLRTLGFSFLAFMLVAGGPFGFEAAVRAAGPLPCFIAFIACPLVWSLPQALITAELASEYPDTGGNVLWATLAFGDIAGWLAGANGLLASLLDLALYPSLVAQAVSALTGATLTAAADWTLRVSVVLGVTALNACGLDAVSRFSAGSVLLVVAPFAASLLAQLPAVVRGGAAWAQVAAAPNWVAFMPVVLWSYSGWDSLGVFAAEVERPARTYSRGVLLTLAAVTAAYALPLIVSIQTHPRFATWEAGSFVAFCRDAGPLTHAAAAIAAVISPMSTMAACLSASTRMAWALAGGSGGAPVRHLPRLCAREVRGAPAAALIAHAAFLILASGAAFGVLVQLTVILSSVRVLLNAAAFVHLRRSRLHLRAATAAGLGSSLGGVAAAPAFAVPGGWLGVAAVTVPQVCVVIAILASAGLDVVLGALGVQAAAAAAFAVRAALDRRQHGRWWPRGFANLATGGPGGHQHRHRGDCAASASASPPETLFDIKVDDGWQQRSDEEGGESESDSLLLSVQRR